MIDLKADPLRAAFQEGPVRLVPLGDVRDDKLGLLDVADHATDADMVTLMLANLENRWSDAAVFVERDTFHFHAPRDSLAQVPGALECQRNAVS